MAAFAPRWWACLALLLCWPAAVRALDPARTVFQYACENWSRRNGLPVNGIRTITQTPDGYLWLGTQNGLVRFDGIAFQSYHVPTDAMLVSENISKIWPARRGGLWFGLREGAVGHFSDGKFSPLRAPWVEPNMSTYALAEASDGALWVGWNFGYARWVEGRQETPPAEHQVGTVSFHAIYEDAQGRVWLGTGNSGQFFYLQDGVRHDFPDEAIKKLYHYAIAVDPAGNIWVGTNDGLRCFDAAFRPKRLPVSSISGRVNAIEVDRHGVVWVGTVEGGLFRYHEGKVSQFTKAHGLVDDNVQALHEDAEGSLWVGTQAGLTQLSDVKFPLYSTTEGLASEPLGIAVSATGTLWAGTTRGLTFLDGEKTTTFLTAAGLTNTWIRRVWEAKNGELYFLDGDKDIAIMSGGRVVARHHCAEWSSGLAEDARGVLIGIGNNIARVDRTGIEFLRNKYGEPIRVGWIMNICVARDGAVWAATHEGVWRIQDGEARQWSIAEGLASSVANWVFEDADGAIWAGLATGVARIKDGQLRNITSADGLFGSFVQAIVPDDLGWFWVDSRQGIYRVRRQDLNDFADGKLDRVSCEGFTGSHVVKGSDKGNQEFTGIRTRDGRIWFPAVQGLIAIDPRGLTVNRVAPPVYIERTRINDQEFVGTGVPRVAAGKGEVEFHYTALSFIAPQTIRFRYQLAGYDEKWIEAGGRRSAFYTNLRPGKYVFHVQACNADGVWSPRGDTLAFELPPHFYQTGWFAGLCALGVLLMLGGIYAWRTRVLRRRQRQLQEAHDLLEVGVRQRTAELERTNALLRDQIAERERMELAAVEAGKQLLLATRQAGMAEVATSVLHNVGNVLNSVNVSAILLADQLRDSRVVSVPKLAKLLEDNAGKPEFLSSDEKGRKVPDYLKQLSDQLLEERARMRSEVDSLRKNVEHIKDIVQMQQTYSRMSGLSEEVTVNEIVDDTLRLNGASLLRHDVVIAREIEEGLTLVVEKHKLLQILVNLVRNATLACTEAKRPDSRITLRAKRHAGNVRIDVIDNGVGIIPENLTKIFTQGFTTRKNGHGYGLHSSANAAKAMGGQLSAQSAGLGAGATFTLVLPSRPRRGGSAAPFAAGASERAEHSRNVTGAV